LNRRNRGVRKKRRGRGGKSWKTKVFLNKGNPNFEGVVSKKRREVIPTGGLRGLLRWDIIHLGKKEMVKYRKRP